jgi:Transposase DDE domain group 1
MPTECSPDFFGFEPVDGRAVVAAFDAGAVTSDAGALLLGATDRAIGMMDRLASCFHDVRSPELIEHQVVTLVAQRVFGIALGYEDLNDHDELRHDPMLAVLAGKLAARREDCAPVAGKSTLNRLELSRLEPARYHRISHNPVAIKRLFVDLFLEAHEPAPNQIILDLDATDDPVHGEQERRFFHGYYDCYCYRRSTCSAGAICWPPSCGARTSMLRPARWRRWRALTPYRLSRLLRQRKSSLLLARRSR